MNLRIPPLPDDRVFFELNSLGLVAVSVELSLIDAVHRDFLRAILAQKRDDLDVLVYVTSTFKEPKFHNVKRDIEIFREILSIPILLVGLVR